MTTPSPAPIPTFPCPQCGKPSTWTDNAFRPFCTERCKLIDLGAWANEDYRVAEKDAGGTAARTAYEDDV
jgi:endogenous inhibitor of DNA gyrase (YacG/DUF329 family)